MDNHAPDPDRPVYLAIYTTFTVTAALVALPLAFDYGFGPWRWGIYLVGTWVASSIATGVVLGIGEARAEHKKYKHRK